MSGSKLVAMVATGSLLSLSPYGLSVQNGIRVQESTASCTEAVGGTCTDAGCVGGPADCYRPPTGGMCYTTIRTE